MRRRNFLGLSAMSGVGIFGGAHYLLNSCNVVKAASQADFMVQGTDPLKVRAAAKNIIYGATTHLEKLQKDPAFAQQFVKECGILVPEGELKWRSLRPSSTTFNFQSADVLLQYCQQNNLLMRGHTLVWHSSIPDWFAGTVTTQNAEQILVDHITTVVNHYKGKLHSWDVVNEAINVPDGNPDGLRTSPWLSLLGPRYLDIAFKTTATVDPSALRVYNEFGLDYGNSSSVQKRTATLKLLERLLNNGSPVQALGIQAHIWSRDMPKYFNPASFKQFLKDVASLGLKILITELDVADVDLPLDIPSRDLLIATSYQQYLDVALAEPAVIALLTWGLSDRYTWISDYYPRSDGAPVRPLPLDAQLQRKLAWNAIAGALDRAPKR